MERTRFEGGNVVYNSYSKRGKNYLINHRKKRLQNLVPTFFLSLLFNILSILLLGFYKIFSVTF